MKTFITVVFLFAGYFVSGQAEYEITKDPKDPEVRIFRGTIDKYLLQNDSAFKKWYMPNHNIYSPDSAILSIFKNVKTQKLQFIVFCGTWCEDSEFIVPRFFKLQELSGVPDDHVTLFGVNREKKALGNIAAALGVTSTPTIIVMKEGKELGRVAEYGKTGEWDKELAIIVDLD